MTRNPATTFRFGPFELDSVRRQLTRDRQRVELTARQVDVLQILVERAGNLVPKDDIIQRAWGDTAITDNSLVQVVRALRTLLGNQAHGGPYIEHHTRNGYRFLAPVATVRQAKAPANIDALLAPYLAFVDGRAALERLDRAAALDARTAFGEMTRVEPGAAIAHIGLATACLLGYESTRIDDEPARALLDEADASAREGCRLDPTSAHAWGTFALVRHRAGDGREAVAAARKALSIDPDDWMHHFRLAVVSWGSERLRAARQALALRPGVALAHWLAATVFVARGELGRAEAEVREGVDSEAAVSVGRFRGAGLHWLLGLVLAAQAREDEAHEQLARELGQEDADHVYGREASANAFYAVGALRLRAGRPSEAAEAFRQALARVPTHALARLCASPVELPSNDRSALATGVVSLVDQAIGASVWMSTRGRHQEAAGLCAATLLTAPAGSAGWILPVEPTLNVRAHRDIWAPALATLRERAT